MNTTEIHPGTGLGKIKFGITRDHLTMLFGEPDEAIPTSDEDGETETWHYDELDLSVMFDGEEDWKLTAFSVTSDEFTLNGKVLIGKSLMELYRELDKMDFDDIDTEELSEEDEPDQLMVSVDEAAINFWVEEGSVKEIQWAPLLNEEQEIVWPK